jgi:hypothetical protein
MSYESGYFWIVLCKNHKFHRSHNILFEHRIPLAETDPYQTPPELAGDLKVRCDECGHEYAYRSKDLLRIEMEPPQAFTPHPLFTGL